MKKTLLLSSLLFLAGQSFSQVSLPINWDDTVNNNYGFIDFGGNVSAIVGDPTNASNLVLQSEKTAGAQSWAGTTLGGATLASPIPFSAGNTIIKAVVYSPDAGATVLLKVENAASQGATFVETQAVTSVANGWDTLTFDFSNPGPNTNPINFANSYDMVSIFYNFGVDGATAGAKTYYLDWIDFVPGSGGNQPTDSVNITFNLNMNLAGADPSGVYIAGGATFGAPGVNEMLDPDNDGIYTITVRRPRGFTGHYTFANGNCPDYSCKENIGGQSCADPANFNDRLLTNVQSDTTISTCFSFCTTDGSCPAPSDSSEVTFRINMASYSGTFVQPHVTGALGISDWGCGTCNAMTDDNADGIWEITLTLANGTYEYKFTHDNWTGQENFDPATGDSACTVTDGTFTNRVITVSGDASTPVFCWEECVECTSGNVGEINANSYKILTSGNQFTIQGLNGVESIRVFDLVGKSVEASVQFNQSQANINLTEQGAGLYFIIVDNGVSQTALKVVVK